MLQQASQTEVLFHEQMSALVRALGLHRPDQTPCGQPVSVAEAHTLMELSRAEPLGQHDLVVRLQLEKSTVSRLVAQLAARGWVERSRDPQDRRAVQIRLTPAGRQAATELADARRSKWQRVIAAVPAGQRTQVLAALDILVEALHEH